ncbi:MAG: zinc ribbon domain-containing protein [Phascolarctobacterium sp.]|nr:zinc ribbon domain-containing protein [Phascolarctobacterium sp.]
MTILDQLRDMAKVAAEKTNEMAKTVGEKAGAAIEVQKYSSLINKEQSNLKVEYRKIGETMYKKFAEEGKVPEGLQESCDAVTSSLAKIDVYNKKIAIIKADKLIVNMPKIMCPGCGKEIIATSKFCPECGATIEENANISDIWAEIEEERKAREAAKAAAKAEEWEDELEADIEEGDEEASEEEGK